MTTKSTYALLIYRTLEGDLSRKDERRALEGHRSLQALAGAAGDLHAVARLDDVTDAKTISVQKGVHAVTDGPYIDTKEWLVGFYLIDCTNQAEAVERAKMICAIDGHAIEVRPVGWRWKK
ncbi:MAG: YciI family protein [Deltaproteobacteria bacterium]|nr:YciI family protein [Deltaproteobacteria bacterium]